MKIRVLQENEELLIQVLSDKEQHVSFLCFDEKREKEVLQVLKEAIKVVKKCSIQSQTDRR